MERMTRDRVKNIVENMTVGYVNEDQPETVWAGTTLHRCYDKLPNNFFEAFTKLSVRVRKLEARLQEYETQNRTDALPAKLKKAVEDKKLKLECAENVLESKLKIN